MRTIFNLQSSAFEPIALDTFNAFFCKELKNVYTTNFQDKVHKTFQNLIGTAMSSLELEEYLAEWKKSATVKNTKIAVIISQNHSFFIHAAIDTKKTKHHFLVSGNILMTSDRESDEMDLEVHSFLSAQEKLDGKILKIYPFLSMCRFADDTDEYMFEAVSEAELYEQQCYMRQALSACLSGEKLNAKMNSSWISELSLADTKEAYAEMMMAENKDDVINSYCDAKEGYEQRINNEDGDSGTAITAQKIIPHRILN